MRESEFGRRVRYFLDLTTTRIDANTARRLHQARENALARARFDLAQAALAAPGLLRLHGLLSHARTLLVLCVLTLSVAGLGHWNALQQAAENEEVDSALLADDLPIDAYLDTGFDAWLEHTSQQ